MGYLYFKECIPGWRIKKDSWLLIIAQTYQINVPTSLFGHSSKYYHLLPNMPATV